MKEYVRRGLEGGAIGLSTGLFYIPGTYASTDEVVALNKVNAEYGGVYDTHDRDLEAAYQSVGYESSVRETIEIGERAGTPAIIMVGTNDISGGSVPDRCRRDLEQLVEKCLQAHCIPMLNTIPPRRNHQQAVEGVNEIIRDVAGDRTGFVFNPQAEADSRLQRRDGHRGTGDRPAIPGRSG